MRCGLHYVRFCDLRTKQCTVAPANQAAAKAIADALAGGPLARRKVHAFANHPSGSRPGAPGHASPATLSLLIPEPLSLLGRLTPGLGLNAWGARRGGPGLADPSKKCKRETQATLTLWETPSPRALMGRMNPYQPTKPRVGAPASPLASRPGGTLGVTNPPGPGTGE